MIDNAKMEYIANVVKEFENGAIYRKNNIKDDFTYVILMVTREMFFENEKADLTGLMFNPQRIEIQFEREFVSFLIDFELEDFLDMYGNLDIITRSEYGRTGELPGELKHQIEMEVKFELSTLIDLNVAEVIKTYSGEDLKKLSWDFDSRNWVGTSIDNGSTLAVSVSPVSNPPINSYFIPDNYNFNFGPFTSPDVEELDWKSISMSQIVGVSSDG